MKKNPTRSGESAPLTGEIASAGGGASFGGDACKKSGFFRFRRKEHLKGRNEIKEVFSRGRRIGCKGAKLFVLKNNLPRSRICFTFSRNFGNAVQRNRAKRLGREAYRNLKPSLQSGYDLIFLVYPDDVKPSKPGLDEKAGQLRYLCTKAGLLK